MMPINLRNIPILNIKCSDYCCIISRSSKGESIELLQNIKLIEKSEAL